MAGHNGSATFTPQPCFFHRKHPQAQYPCSLVATGFTISQLSFAEVPPAHQFLWCHGSLAMWLLPQGIKKGNCIATLKALIRCEFSWETIDLLITMHPSTITSQSVTVSDLELDPRAQGVHFRETTDPIHMIWWCPLCLIISIQKTGSSHRSKLGIPIITYGYHILKINSYHMVSISPIILARWLYGPIISSFSNYRPIIDYPLVN